MFDKILIANRGEIACRVAATARRLGVTTVAVYSDADAQARHVQACDEAVHIGGAPPRDSYLQAQRIADAALACGAQAVHPGYGFLSENPAFAQACEDRGLVFIGPSATAIAAMGNKAGAKALMAQRGVPVLPGYHGECQDLDVLQHEAARLGYPLMIKACAGGGGRGMRIVREPGHFADALAACQREASASFGDGSVLLERYIERPRHIEIQIFADAQGQCIHLFERDCSMQRRHQKLVEESPAPGLSPALRERMAQAAIAAAQAVDYCGAGTVEFIVETDAQGRPGAFFFMEMNTRLQVEHPVTECVTGLDLVEWQLRVAAGEPLPLAQQDLRQQGHAIEVRLCAERPEKNFLPSTGLCRVLRFPQATHFTLPSGPLHDAPCVRVDSGLREGDTVSAFYDAMVAKLIVWAPDRQQALAAMQQALSEVEVEGVSTNAAFLRRLVAHPRFAAGQLDTRLVEAHLQELVLPTQNLTESIAS